MFGLICEVLVFVELNLKYAENCEKITSLEIIKIHNTLRKIQNVMKLNKYFEGKN